MNDRPWLIIPIETKARELDAKTYFAAAAAESGFRVILGEQNALLRRLSHLPRGLYLDKSVARSKVCSFERLRKLGFRIAAWCEEGLVYRDRDAYLHERIAPLAFAQADAFFAWGHVQSSDIRRVIPDPGARLLETGNPRFDLLRPGMRELYRPTAEALRARFGEFILINTNFARYNHYFGRDQVIEIIKRRGSIRNATDEAFFRGWVDFLGDVFHSFEDMLPRLAHAFPRRNIILRPHPSENHDTWRRIAACLPNVHVIYEGGAMPWILAAEVAVHNSCTTGLEGALLERPVFAYREARSETYDSYLPHRVSINVDTFDDLVAALEMGLAGKYQAPLESDPQVREDAARYIASLDGPEATPRILAKMATLTADGAESHKGSLAASIRDRSEQFARTLARTALAPLRTTQGYAKQKFPGLETYEVQSLIERFRELTGRFSSVQVHPAHSATVRLENG